MKFIPFKTYGNVESRTFLIDMLLTSPPGQTLGQMRERLKVLTKIESAPAEGVTLARRATSNGCRAEWPQRFRRHIGRCDRHRR